MNTYEEVSPWYTMSSAVYPTYPSEAILFIKTKINKIRDLAFYVQTKAIINAQGI
jgi:hypothetical protein